MLDTSAFKILSHNDTGQAAGHQGGIVIPRDIESFFPPLIARPNSESPTVDVRLRADLFVDGYQVAAVDTRYQHQTWGGTRSPERRLTHNLGPLRNQASRGDIVLFTKDLIDDGYIQLHLLRQGTHAHKRLTTQIGAARWGPADPSNPPVSIKEIEEAENFIDEEVQQPAMAFGPERQEEEVVTVRKARDRAFRNQVLSQYDFRCAFTGQRIGSPVSSKVVGLDAAHVVPVHLNGTDHPANGLALTKDMHWAFDNGLVGVAKNRTVFVPEVVAKHTGNDFLRELNGTRIREALTSNLQVLEEALEWHRSNVIIK